MHLEDDASKINTVIMYLGEDGILWWRRRELDIKSGSCSINTSDEFKKDFKRQFYLENVKAVALKKLRELRHTDTIKEYIRQSTSLVHEVDEMSEEIQLIYFTGGLQRWAEQELQRRGVKSLAEAIAVAESLIEIPRESRRDNGKRVEEGNQDDDEASYAKAKHADHGKDKAKCKWESKGDDRDGDKLSKPFKCFVCEGPQLARYCPMRQKLSAMIATGEESTPTMRIGEMVMNEDARLANMRLLNTLRVKNDEPKVRKSSISSSMDIKQGGSLMVINGEVNEVPTRLLVQPGVSHNFLAREEAKALGVKFTRVDGEIKAINSRATPVYGKAWNVPVRLGKWKGKVDFLVVGIDDEDVVLGMEFLHKVQPFRVSEGMITITSKERDVRVPSLKAWWADRQRCQGTVLGRTKTIPMLGTRHHGGTMGLKCEINWTDGAATQGSIQGSSGALDQVVGTYSIRLSCRGWQEFRWGRMSRSEHNWISLCRQSHIYPDISGKKRHQEIYRVV
ncbi:unnamed protein product [Amaranthus hypochondriacus]